MMRSTLNKSRSRRYFVYASGCLKIAAAIALGGCSKSPSTEAEEQSMIIYKQELLACQRRFFGEVKVPIIGGGTLDRSKLGFTNSSLALEKGQCGIKWFEARFYWTGDTIVPGNSLTPEQAKSPPPWSHIRVAAGLSGKTNCSSEPGNCGKWVPVNPGTWPKEYVINLNNYSLDAWLSQKKLPGNNTLLLVPRDWSNDDGTPKFIYCDIGRSVDSISVADIKNIDFGRRTLPCQIEMHDFVFDGGAARVAFSTNLLHTIAPALQSLQKYLSESID